MRLKHIEVFNALMSTGSVVGAARLLFISPPAVSKALKMVEDELGFLLFQRVQGRLEATAEAQALYEEVAKIPPQLAALRTLTQQLKTGDGGLDVHTHDFEVIALVIEGSITVRCAEIESVYESGQVFHLAFRQPHSERYGRNGVKYLASRKSQ